MIGPLAAAVAIFDRDITAERWRQLKLHGIQHLPDGTGQYLDAVLADELRRECDDAFKAGRGTWRHILLEEVHEALAETDWAKLRKELIEVATVAIAWVEDGDHRAGDREPRVPVTPQLSDNATQGPQGQEPEVADRATQEVAHV